MDVDNEIVPMKQEIEGRCATYVENIESLCIECNRLDYEVKKENQCNLAPITFENVMIDNTKEMCEGMEEYEYTDATGLIDKLDIKNEYITATYSQSKATKNQENEAKTTNHLVHSKVDKRSLSCYTCKYTTNKKYDFLTHMKKHRDLKKKATLVSQSNEHFCTECNKEFRKKRSLDDHILKNHPNLVASINSKIHKCVECTYETTHKHNLHKHLLSHTGTTATPKHSCIHCQAVFKYKIALDRHIVKKHPNFIASATNTVHECISCPYKTVSSRDFAAHMLNHPEETADGYSVFFCQHCEKRCRSKLMLDQHITKNHPDFISSVTSKIHQCTKCEYKTTLKANLARHMLKHFEIYSGSRPNKCDHCNAKLRNKRALDDHIIKKHPSFIESLTNKTYNCLHCTFETTVERDLYVHVLEHDGITSKFKFSTCTECNAQFKDKRYLDNHIFKNHPELMVLMKSKIFECLKCEYKTIFKRNMSRHISIKHPDGEIAPS